MAKNINLNVGNMPMSFQGIELARFRETGSGGNADYIDLSELDKFIYAVTLNWLEKPSEDEKNAEIAKFQNIIKAWKADNTLSTVSVRVMYDGVLCPAAVSIFEENSCYIYFSDFDKKVFMEIRYIATDAEPLEYISKKWGYDRVVETSDALPTSKAVADYVDEKIAALLETINGTGNVTNTDLNAESEEII